MSKQFVVNAEWDDEAGVYVATSDDVPGLVTEARTLDELQKRVRALIPELLEDNAHLLSQKDDTDDLVRLCVESSFFVSVPARTDATWILSPDR